MVHLSKWGHLSLYFSSHLASSFLIDGVVVVVPVQEDVEAEREGEDEQGIPAKEGWMALPTSTSKGKSTNRPISSSPLFSQGVKLDGGFSVYLEGWTHSQSHHITLSEDGRKNSPNQKHDESRGNFVEHGHVDVVLAQSRVPPDHGYQNRPID